MSTISRFACASSPVTLGSLLNRTRRALVTCFALGLLIHLSLTQIRAFQPEQRVAKPLTTHFVKRQPRLTKPLEIKKRPQPKRRAVQRKMVAVKARLHRSRQAAAFGPAQMLRGLATPTAQVARVASLAPSGFESQAASEVIGGTRETEQKIDTSLEMLDIGALDTGKYHAMLIQDPTDRRNLRGFLHIAMAAPMRSGMTSSSGLPALQRLAEMGMNRFTNIRTDVWPPLGYDSSKLFQIPWLFTPTGGKQRRDMSLTEGERENLGLYLMSGGFLHADAYPPRVGQACYPPVGHQNLIITALATQGLSHGRDWIFQTVPSSHAIYHCYFDFEAPPPGYGAYHALYEVVYFMEGVTFGGRLLAVISRINLAQLWQCWGRGDGWGTGGKHDATRGFQFGVNSIVFALTQEGSITHQVMENVH